MAEAFAIDPRVMQTITRHLDALRVAVEGGELYGLIQRVLRKHGRLGPLTQDCLAELYGQLDTYARDPITVPGMRIRARLLQQHIGAYLPESENNDQDMMIVSETPRAVPKPAVDIEYIEAAPAPEPVPAAPKDEAAMVSIEGELERPSEETPDASPEKYQALLRSEKDAWQAIYGTVKDYHKLKQAWMKSLDELARQRDALEEKLVKTSEHLTLLEGERDRLKTDLDKAREAPKKPRLLAHPRSTRVAVRTTGLPRREQFVRELENEIKRIKRSGAPLALGLIGLVQLERIGEEQGAEAVEAVLRCYTTEVLSNFRAYDRVALYERDQFAVMFPDTGKDGARRAIEKAYKRAIETHLSHQGKSFPLPPFAGVLIVYSAGEDPAMFLDRADVALAAAREQGQTGVILA